jgi:hypothetical protein
MKEITTASDGETRVDLVVSDTYDVVGRLLTANGQPVAGVQGYVYGERPEAPLTSLWLPFQTNATGEFTLRLGSPVPSLLNIQIYARERGTAAFRVPVQETFDLHLPPIGADIVLEFRNYMGGSSVATQQYLVNGKGAMIPLPLAIAFGSAVIASGTQTTLVTIHNLAPGVWRLVPFSPADRIPHFLFGSSKPALLEFTAQSGGRHRFEVSK